VEEAQRRHIPAAPVNTTNDFLTSEQEIARGFIIEVEDPVVGRMKMLKDPFGMKVTPWSMTGPAPRLDQHRQEILALAPQKPVPAGGADSAPAVSGKRMPLEGIRVLDFTRVRSGPTGTVIMADFGAEVIKVESTLIENQGGDGVPQFDSNNRNKKSIKVNMKEPRGRELFLELVKKADVVTDNFTYKVMDNLGIGYEDLKKVNPRIIMAGMPPMGKSGPIAGWTTYGQQLMAFSGMSYLWGHKESPMPAHPKVPYPDDTAASQLIVSIMAALEHRDQTGEGQYIEVAQCEGLAYMLSPAYLDKLVNDNTWGPLGNWHPVAAPFGAYPTKGEDDWVFVSCETEEHWQNLVKVLGNAGWTEEEQFRTQAGRRANKAALDERLGEWTRQYTARQAEWMLQKGRVPVYMVEENEDQYYDLHLWQRGFLQRGTFPKWGDSVYRSPITRFSDTPGQVRHAMPEPGQDNVEVFGKLLGMPEAEVKRLEKEKVIY
jgi:benzylsuccinate CoA-transferase BbsF subunit